MTDDAPRRREAGSQGGPAGRELLWMRTWTAAAVVLPLVTWPLWFGGSEFPAVPLATPLESLPQFWQSLAATVMLVSAALLGVGRPRLRDACLLAYLLSVLLLWSANQHRMQPWSYQFAILAAVHFFVPWPRARRLLQVLAISIYFYSAAGKFDYSFVHSFGATLVRGPLEAVGVEWAALPRWLQTMLVLAPPAVELSVAAGLCLPRTRRIAAWTAMVMHGLLILRLGPLGLGHEWGVLCWNAFFLAQAWLLFLARPAAAEAVETGGLPRRPGWGGLLIAVVVLGPLLEPWGYWDHWLAWGLYSTRNSRAVVEIRPTALEQLPAEARTHVGPPNPRTGWAELHLADWSLESLAAPIYPQARFQRRVAAQLRRQGRMGRAMRVRIYGMADRFTGRRDESDAFFD